MTLLHAPRLSRLAFAATVLAVVPLVIGLFAVIQIGFVSREMRGETIVVGERLAALAATLRQEVESLPDLRLSGCTEAGRARTGAISIASIDARGYFVAVDDNSTWCGPSGVTPSVEPSAGALTGDAGISFHFTGDDSIARPTAALLSNANGQRLLAELDDRSVRALIPGSDETHTVWNKAFVPVGGAANTSTTDLSPWGRFELIHRVTEYPQQHLLLIQRVRLEDLRRAALASWPLLLISSGLLAVLVLFLEDRSIRDRSDPVRRLERAVRKRQFEPFVQPVVSLQSGECVGGEVLMRWMHPLRGIVSPAEFIAVAEETGLIDPMSEILMVKARERLAPLVQHDDQLRFAFNVTPHQLRNPAIRDTLDHMFDGVSLSRRHVVLELTERQFVDDRSRQSIARLHAAGYRLAIDDFGTGHSSLSSLEHLPLSRIKIDRSFVCTIDAATVNRPVLDAIIALAHDLRIPLIAEGVETQAQWDYLRDRQVEYAQGYLIARPMSIAAFQRWKDGRESSGPPERVARAARSTPALGAAIGVFGIGNSHQDERDRLWLSQIDHIGTLSRLQQTSGIEIRDRMYRLQRYPQCFVGSEAVDWISAKFGVTRSLAVRLGRRWIANGLIRHAADEHDFEDEYLFYQVVDDSSDTVSAGPTTALPPLDDVLAAMRHVDGVPLKTRQRHFVRYPPSFAGAEACDWLSARYGVSRAAAVWMGLQLMGRGALRHVFDDRPFADGPELFVFS